MPNNQIDSNWQIHRATEKAHYLGFGAYALCATTKTRRNGSNVLPSGRAG